MQRELWRTVLSTPTQNCLWELEALPPPAPVDVLLTDQPLDDELSARLASAAADGTAAAAHFDGGVIEVGAAGRDHSPGVAPQDPIVGPATVSLPSDATARELKLAVLLVTQIVRMRREDHVRDQLRDAYQQLAFQDPLTGIANRRAWDQELAKRWEDRYRAAGPICLALFDIDQLKQINDAVGHAEGDAVLRATASALVASVRDQDFVARLGGDEFGVLLDDINPASAHQIVDRIRCSTSRYLATGQTTPDELPVTASAGYACPQPDDSAESLYRRADEALLASKRAGSNATTGDGGSR